MFFFLSRLELHLQGDSCMFVSVVNEKVLFLYITHYLLSKLFSLRKTETGMLTGEKNERLKNCAPTKVKKTLIVHWE